MKSLLRKKKLLYLFGVSKISVSESKVDTMKDHVCSIQGFVSFEIVECISFANDWVRLHQKFCILGILVDLLNHWYQSNIIGLTSFRLCTISLLSSAKLSKPSCLTAFHLKVSFLWLFLEFVHERRRNGFPQILGVEEILVQKQVLEGHC